VTSEVERAMVRFWRWARASNERAVDNARAAATELGRRRVERDEVELYLAELGARRAASA
jgi:hypothetical protein